MYIMVAVPVLKPVNKPPVLIVAVVSDRLVQLPPVPDALRVMDAPAQTEVAPVIVPATGRVPIAREITVSA
jgi:hypothetical protein